MKTPKRYQDKPTPLMPEDSEPDWYVLYQWCQRAKRKNKIKQLKRTISKLNEEKRHLLRLLKLSTLSQFEEADKASIDWCMKHLTVDTFEAKRNLENGMFIKSGISPRIMWDGKEI